MPLAHKLGFNRERLSTGVYCADPTPFLDVWRQRQQIDPVKKLVYVGRYLEFKGVADLWQYFIKLSPNTPNGSFTASVRERCGYGENGIPKSYITDLSSLET